ncbi:MAG TPA: GDSL-type esterase/lipase family protein [Candidatus Methanoperedens sp.]|nr:GDSL-type esterase/lipase family protein [Candidatus Methanoperedens sp.]
MARRALGNLVAVLLGIALLPLAELLLAGLGVNPLAEEDPFVGFEGSRPLFLESRGDPGLYSLNPAKEQSFNRQSFRMPKPPGAFRIVAFGGSTTYGHPYAAPTSFPTWMVRILQRYDPSRIWESVNAGGISYASYRVRRLMEELAAFSPDLYVVYSGHNEFLEARTFGELRAESPGRRRLRALLHRSRLYSAIARLVDAARRSPPPDGRTVLGDEVQPTLEEVGGPELYHRDEAFRDGVIRQYRAAVEGMVRLSRKRGIPLILCTLPSNLSGLAPFKSEHREGLAPAELAAWERAVAAAGDAWQGGRLEEALARLEEARRIDDRYAKLHYLKGEVLRRLGRQETAYAAYLRAKDEDIVSVRALEAFNDIVRDVARREGVALADVEARVRAASPDGIPGPPFFVDHVHPGIEGHLFIAWAVLETAVDNGLVPLSRAELERGRGAAAAALDADLREIPPKYRAAGHYVAGRTLRWAGLYDEAYVQFQEAWQALHDAPELRDVPDLPYLLGELEYHFQRPAAALPYYLRALALDPGSSDYLLGLAKAQVALGDAAAALRTLARRGDIEHDRPIFLMTRGEAQALRGDLPAALRDLESAVALAPGVPALHLSLARLRLRSGDEPRARESFRRSLELSGAPWSEAAYEVFRVRVAPPRPPVSRNLPSAETPLDKGRAERNITNY